VFLCHRRDRRQGQLRTWVDLSTVANGTTIAGERGGVMRDMKDGESSCFIRELQNDAKKTCFIRTD
jgi:hypothetical protein